MDEIHDVLCPSGQQDDFTQRMLTEFEYVGAKKVGDTYIGLQRLMFTIAICVGVDELKPFTKRYCYDDLSECLHHYKMLDDLNHVPTGFRATR